MRAVLHTFWAPKSGNSEDEYEDAFAPGADDVFTGERLRFAVADGATEASYSGRWARLLVQGYRKGWLGVADPSQVLQRLARIWRRGLQSKKLPWYAQEKLRRGAFAALLGLELSTENADDQDGAWNAYSVGDCCLFHVAGDRLLTSFPFNDPRDFGSRPLLLSSVAERNGAAIASTSTISSRWSLGDRFYLVSDALAACFLAEHQGGNPPWPLAHSLGTPEAEYDFWEWMSKLREQRALRNDDVTLVRIALE